MFSSKLQGVGLGLRKEHYSYVLTRRPKVPWFEAVTENYIAPRGLSTGRPLEILKKVRKDYPIALHGVSLSIGSTDPVNQDYLGRLSQLIDMIQPEIVSDHLCWTGVGGVNLHDLMPLPYTGEALRHVVQRVEVVQNFLKRPILLENVSSYITYPHSSFSEWDFLREVSLRSGCSILLDVNNVYVSSVNHGFDPLSFLEAIPKEKVQQFHLAGFSEGKVLVDTHDHPVSDPVWNLFDSAVSRFGQVPTLIEWDSKIPEFQKLEEEAIKARKFFE